MNTARKQPGAFWVGPGDAAEGHQHGGGAIREFRCVREQLPSDFLYGPCLLHRVVDEKAERRKFRERLKETCLNGKFRRNVQVLKQGRTRGRRSASLSAL